MNYSIKDLENLSGIRAHTIRIWEKRYKLFSPVRSETNIRSYNGSDLKRLLNIAQLNREGIKISRIVAMTPAAMDEEVLRLFKESKEVELILERLIASMIDLNELQFEHVLADLLVDNPFETVVMKYIFPFLERIGLLWQTGSISPAQEHFISNIIRSTIIIATANLPLATTHKPEHFILYLPESELHEIGLLFCNYLLRKSGYKTIYLGQSVPLSDLIAVQKEYNARYIITSLISSSLIENTNEYLKNVDLQTPNCTLIALGNQMHHTKYHSDTFHAFTSFDKFLSFLKSN